MEPVIITITFIIVVIGVLYGSIVSTIKQKGEGR